MPRTIGSVIGMSMAVVVACGACFPTLQTARIDPGFHLDASMTLIADQPVTNGPVEYPQGPDVIAVLVPAYGFGHRFELGLPIGFYGENGLKSDSRTNEERLPILLPYAKLALLSPESRHSLAVIGQAALLVPANLGLRYAYDYGSWEPQVGISRIYSEQARDGRGTSAPISRSTRLRWGRCGRVRADRPSRSAFCATAMRAARAARAPTHARRCTISMLARASASRSSLR